MGKSSPTPSSPSLSFLDEAFPPAGDPPESDIGSRPTNAATSSSGSEKAGSAPSKAGEAEETEEEADAEEEEDEEEEEEEEEEPFREPLRPDAGFSAMERTGEMRPLVSPFMRARTVVMGAAPSMPSLKLAGAQ